MANRFVLNETSYHGKGAIESIPEEAKARGRANPRFVRPYSAGNDRSCSRLVPREQG